MNETQSQQDVSEALIERIAAARIQALDAIASLIEVELNSDVPHAELFDRVSIYADAGSLIARGRERDRRDAEIGDMMNQLMPMISQMVKNSNDTTSHITQKSAFDMQTIEFTSLLHARTAAETDAERAVVDARLRALLQAMDAPNMAKVLELVPGSKAVIDLVQPITPTGG